MFPRLFVNLVLGGALIGGAMGFLHQFWWLLLPPLVFGAYFLGGAARGAAGLRYYGLPVFPTVLMPSAIVTGWNSLIQTAIFFVGLGVSSLFTGG